MSTVDTPEKPQGRDPREGMHQNNVPTEALGEAPSESVEELSGKAAADPEGAGQVLNDPDEVDGDVDKPTL